MRKVLSPEQKLSWKAVTLVLKDHAKQMSLGENLLNNVTPMFLEQGGPEGAHVQELYKS